jgi:hypothetical protein
MRMKLFDVPRPLTRSDDARGLLDPDPAANGVKDDVVEVDRGVPGGCRRRWVDVDATEAHVPEQQEFEVDVSDLNADAGLALVLPVVVVVRVKGRMR